MVHLKHNQAIKPRRPDSLIAKVRYSVQIKPLNTIASKKSKPKQQPTKIIQKPRHVRVMSVAKPTLVRHPVIKSTRVSRSIPATKARMRGRTQVLNRPYAAISSSETINALRGKGAGRTLIIIGNGPSHKEADLARLKGANQVDIMSINKPDDRLWPTNYWLFCDSSQLKRHKNIWNTYGGVVINSTAIKESKRNGVRVRTMQGKGFSLNLNNGFYIGRSSVYAALQVAIWMDYSHVYVFGVDMTAVNGKLYPWGSNPDVSDQNRAKRFKMEAESFMWLANNVDKKITSKMTFCSKYNPWDFVKKFEKLDHVEAVGTILQRLQA